MTSFMCLPPCKLLYLISQSRLSLTESHLSSGEPLFNVGGPGNPRDSTNKLITPPPVVAVVAPDCSSNPGVLPQYPVFDIQIHPKYTGQQFP